MQYVLYTIGFVISLLFPLFRLAGDFGIEMTMVLDPVSFLTVFTGSYFLAGSAVSKINNEKHIELWGKLSLNIGLISFFIGLFYMLASMNSGAHAYSALAHTLIPILYGLVIKYLIVRPYIFCKKNCP